MKTTNQNLPENYIQEILETYAIGVEKNKNDSKALLVDLLKKSATLGKCINNFEDYKLLQETVADMEANGSFSSVYKLVLKELKDFIAREYRQYGQQWLEKKHKEEQECLKQKYKTEEEDFSKLFPQSVETQEKYLNPSYIDDLMQKNNLEEESIRQLNAIKSLLVEHDAKIDSKRLIIKTNLVCIDGYTLPTRVTNQFYKNMKADPKNLTYPNYAKALLKFTADITGTKFAFPANRDKLQKGEIDREEFIGEINTTSNKAILKTLHSIVGFNSVIPVGLDKDGYVIYAGVRSDGCYFGRYNIATSNYYGYGHCLVSSA